MIDEGEKKTDVEKNNQVDLTTYYLINSYFDETWFTRFKVPRKKRSEKIKNAKFSIILHLSFPSTRSLHTGRRAHISVDWGDPYIELNSTSVAYISELLKDISMFLTLLNISACCSLRFYFVKRAPVTWFAKFNYLEKRRFVKISRFKSREIFIFQIREIKVARN